MLICIKKTLTLLLSLAFIIACADMSSIENIKKSLDPNNSSERNDIKFKLDKQYTTSTKNKIELKALEDEGLEFKISALDLTSASVALDQWIDLKKWQDSTNTIEVSYKKEQKYELLIIVRNQEGYYLLNEKIEWSYNVDPPKWPVITFAKKAVATDTVSFIFSTANLDVLTDEVWIEGDLAENAKGSWEKIPESLVLEKKLNAGDGVKNFKVKYRSLFILESLVTDLSIIKKTTIPQSCKVTLAANSINTKIVPIYLQAEDSYAYTSEAAETYYRVTNLETSISSNWKTFTKELSSIFEYKKMASGSNKFKIEMRDIAENECSVVENEEIEIIYDPSYERAQLKIVGDLLHTKDENIQIEAKIDHLPSQELEMHIFGDVNGDNTHKWIAYSENITNIKLKNGKGNRWIGVKFREKGSDTYIDASNYAPISLNPFVSIKKLGKYTQVYHADFSQLQSVTIFGCEEDYFRVDNNIEGYPCTPRSSKVTMYHDLSDGSVLKVEEKF